MTSRPRTLHSSSLVLGSTLPKSFLALCTYISAFFLFKFESNSSIFSFGNIKFFLLNSSIFSPKSFLALCTYIS